MFLACFSSLIEYDKRHKAYWKNQWDCTTGFFDENFLSFNIIPQEPKMSIETISFLKKTFPEKKIFPHFFLLFFSNENAEKKYYIRVDKLFWQLLCKL